MTRTKKQQTPFKLWLAVQPRNELTHDPRLLRSPDLGWTVESFYLEARKRGVKIGFWSAISWEQGTRPASMTLEALVEKFPSIKF